MAKRPKPVRQMTSAQFEERFPISDGAVHANTIEGFWSIFKRGVVGTFHKMGPKYRALYVAEFQFWYNNRFNADMFGTAIAGC